MNPMSVIRQRPTYAISIAAALIAAAAAVFFAARFAFPYFVEAISPAVPYLQVWLVPPYLFITVHVIIAAIWKLSEQKLHGNPKEKEIPNPYAVKPVDLPLGREVTPLKAVTEEVVVETAVTAPVSAESCVTMDSDTEKNSGGMDLEDTWDAIVMKNNATWQELSESAGMAVTLEGATCKKSSETAAAAVAEKSATWQRSTQTAAKKSVTLPNSTQTVAVAEKSATSQRSTETASRKSVLWPKSSETAAMKKSDTWQRSSENAAEVAADGTDGTDELNRRFEAFIKKNYDQIRSF